MGTEAKFKIPPMSKFRGLRLDPEIIELIIELNRAGFVTYGSCAGHPSYSGKGMMRGYISFEGYCDKEGIMKTLEAYGLRSIRIEYGMDHSDDYRGEATLVSFDAIGIPKYSGDDTLDQLDYCERRPELQCVNCWHRWKPEQYFRDTPRCPECGSTWLIMVEAIKMGLRKEHEHKLPW